MITFWNSRLLMMALPILLLLALADPGQAQVLKGSLKHGGIARSYLMYLPKGYDAQQKYPLMLLLHGRLGTGKNVLEYTGMEAIADRKGFIILAPDGYHKSWNDGRERTPAHQAHVDDVRFLGALLDKVQASYSVDLQRVYSVGMSNGGFMTLTLGKQLGHRFAAIAMVVAAVPEKNAVDKMPTHPLPLIVINGTEDPLIKWKGGPISERETELILDTPTFIDLYRKQMACSAETLQPQPDRTQDGTLTVVHTWTGCKPGVEVQLWEVQGGGHTWPGKQQYLHERWIGRTSRDYNGSEAIWTFLERFQLP